MSFTLLKILAVGCGGFAGAVLRYVLGVKVQSHFSSSDFPFGIFIVNSIGCFLIGFLMALFELKQWGAQELRLFIFVGVLGGFTTFSTFANDSFLLFKEGEMLLGLANIGGQIILGLLFVWIGYALLKLFS